VYLLAGIALLLGVATNVRAEEFPEVPDAPSAFTTVIEARDYDDRFESVADLLDHTAGVRVRRYGPLGSSSTASIRGSKPEQVLVLLDGVRLNSAQRGAVDLSTLPLRTIGRIEVIRGGGASRYGSGAVGGVILITTRTPEAGQALDASATTGRYETLGADVLRRLARLHAAAEPE
jgi:iron complex outermembrane receptor protein